MRNFLKGAAPQRFKNYGKHLPAAVLANILYGFPSKKLTVIGVTGTDGKTTTSNMIYQILREAGKKVALVSTINAKIGDEEFETGFHVTSPSSFSLQKYIKKANKAGAEYLVLEVTSHGLDQFRVYGISFDIGVITNVTHEHLDYHKSFENYLNTKAKLIKNSRVAVLNRSEDHFEKLKKLTIGKVVSFGNSKNADFNPVKFPMKLKVPGEFNLMNAMTAVAVCVNLGIDTKRIKKALENFYNLEGRMEEVENNLGAKIYIDFAHTPNALREALKTLKKETKGKLISVFGSASERDREKRPLMGKVSAEISDITILTDEDPRFEDSIKIIDEIAEGCKDVGVLEGEKLYKIPDRQKAIVKAISLLERGDTLGIFGKGHEKSMNIRGEELAWSDKEAVLKALSK